MIGYCWQTGLLLHNIIVQMVAVLWLLLYLKMLCTFWLLLYCLVLVLMLNMLHFDERDATIFQVSSALLTPRYECHISYLILCFKTSNKQYKPMFRRALDAQRAKCHIRRTGRVMCRGAERLKISLVEKKILGLGQGTKMVYYLCTLRISRFRLESQSIFPWQSLRNAPHSSLVPK